MKRARPLLFLCVSFAIASTVLDCARFKKFGYSGFNRDKWQEPGRVLDSLGVSSGMKVAEVGSGGGYFTFRFADKVGAAGRVYAIDVDKEMLDQLSEDVKEKNVSNVIVHAGGFDDPALGDARVDLVFACDVYHHISDPVKYFENAAKYLSPGGRVVIIDFKPEGFLAGFLGHSSKVEKVEADMRAAHYVLDTKFDFLEKQSFLVYRHL
jgi:arsenite methyltransferase